MKETINKEEPGKVRTKGQTVSVTIEVPKKLYKLAKRVYGGIDVRIEDILIEDLIASLDTDIKMSFGELAGWPKKASYRDEIESLAYPDMASQKRLYEPRNNNGCSGNPQMVS